MITGLFKKGLLHEQKMQKPLEIPRNAKFLICKFAQNSS